MADQSLAATCEDYNSDAGEAVPETRTQANATVKLSSPGSEVFNEHTGSNVASAASDSGYSSHTAATMGSVDYSLAGGAVLPPLKLDIPHPSAAPNSRSNLSPARCRPDRKSVV